MTYIKVKWIHTFPDEPVDIYSELDNDRWETRKIEFFADGTNRYVGEDVASIDLDSELSEEPIPSLIEIAADPQFEPVEITKEEFEVVWLKCISATRQDDS